MSQGIVFEFAESAIGNLTSIDFKKSVKTADETNLSDSYTYYQTGTVELGFSCEVIGSPNANTVDVNDEGEISLTFPDSSTSVDYGDFVCTEASVKASVNNLVTMSYTFMPIRANS
jgi:hypothetical protein